MRKISVGVMVLVLLPALAGVGVFGASASGARSSALTVRDRGNVAAVERPRDYTLMLQSRQFVPVPGIAGDLPAEVGADKTRHMIIQFGDIPDRSEISVLRSRGIMLLDYLPNLAYFAKVPTKELARLAEFPGLRSVIGIEPDDKISPHLRVHRAGGSAGNEDGVVRVVVILFSDVDAVEARGRIEQHGRITEIGYEDQTLEVSIPKDRIHELAALDEVHWIEPTPPPKHELIDDVRITVKADSVQAPPYNLTGSGVVLGMWDGGSPAATHEDFAGRLTIADGALTESHATTVAGIMAGDGSRSEAWGGTPYQWRGISTAADIIAYDFPTTLTELRSETSEAISTYGIISSNNSWGWYVCGSLCSYFGTYDSWTRVYDNIVRGSRGALINVVCGAGNDQDCLECQDSLPNFPYGTVLGPMATGKNTIAVGATNALDKTMTAFSSWGPVQDGRVKPDIVAPGCKPTAGVYGPVPPNDYGDAGCGTSFSTPVASGAVGILRQQFDLLGYGDILPHTFKAVLIQTARDLGNPGPDYVFGHGHLELKDAVDLVIADYPENELIRVDSVADAEVDTYHMDVESGVDTFRITLVWDDYKGTPGAAKALINDLDLVVKSPGGAWYYAYNLNPADPSAPATTGYNDVDNVEVVEVAGPEAGRWTISIQGTLVPEGPQDYTLVLPFEYPSAGHGGSEALPSDFGLFSSIPNPFSEITLIRFDLPEAAVVTMRIYDARGRLTRTLIGGSVTPAGRHLVCWDGAGEAGHIVSPGVYFCRIEAGGRVATQRMVFLR